MPATERGIRTSYELTPNLTVIGDHDALRRAAGNLLSNAVCLTTTTITIATGHQDGLGLAIVRQITESHDGRVTIHSTIGTGTTFALWFPTGDRPYGTPPPELPTTPPHPRHQAKMRPPPAHRDRLPADEPHPCPPQRLARDGHPQPAAAPVNW